MALNRPTIYKMQQHLPLQDPPKCTQITIFGPTINLATRVLLTDGPGSGRERSKRQKTDTRSSGYACS
jgi:hypothetical protein